MFGNASMRETVQYLNKLHVRTEQWMMPGDNLNTWETPIWNMVHVFIVVLLK